MEIVESLSEAADLKAGDRVKTLRGSTTVVRILNDGRLVWRPDGHGAELTLLPESLLPDAKSPPHRPSPE